MISNTTLRNLKVRQTLTLENGLISTGPLLSNVVWLLDGQTRELETTGAYPNSIKQLKEIVSLINDFIGMDSS